MFLCMMAIVGIGMLIKFILLPGKEAAVVYGRKVDLLLFGLDRHAWGTIHLDDICVVPQIIRKQGHKKDHCYPCCHC